MKHRVYGSWACITGATSGMGEEFAKQLADLGYNLLLTGRNLEKLQKTKQEIEATKKIKVDIITADLAKASERKDLITKLKEYSGLGMLVNNAGFANKISFPDGDLDTKMISVHIDACNELIHAAVPLLKGNKGGYIINVCSIAAFFPAPQSPLYSATKTYLANLSEALNIKYSADNIKVQALCPGYTRTNFHSNLGDFWNEYSSDKRIRWMGADEVINYSLKSLNKKNQSIVVPGTYYKFLYLMSKLMPKKLVYKSVQ